MQSRPADLVRAQPCRSRQAVHAGPLNGATSTIPSLRHSVRLQFHGPLADLLAVSSCRPVTCEETMTIPVVLLMGPTAAGKSAIAIELAQRLSGEIVSVDSAQVYRGMDIGTAKPDAATQRS